MVVLGKVVGVFIMVLIGYGANKIGWLPVDCSKYLSKIVINIAAPSVVIYSMSQQQLNNETLSVMLILFGLTFILYMFSWLFSFLILKILKIQGDQRGVYKNFLIFTNNAFMGFPVAYALFGSTGMFYMVLANVVFPLLIYTLGVHNLQSHNNETTAKEGGRLEVIKERVKSMINAPIISTFIGLAVFLLQIPIPVVIGDVLDAVGATMAPLCMIVIGLQLTESKPSQVMTNHKLIIVCFLRLLVIPGIMFLVMLPFGIDPLVICIITLIAMLPCSAVCVALAEEYDNNPKLAAEGTFLTTLFSVITIPIIGVLLTTFVL